MMHDSLAQSASAANSSAAVCWLPTGCCLTTVKGALTLKQKKRSELVLPTPSSPRSNAAPSGKHACLQPLTAKQLLLGVAPKP